MRAQIAAMQDTRLRPRINTETVVSGAVVMCLAQLGSLNALEQMTRSNSFWQRWIGDELPSADTMGKVTAQIQTDHVRECIHRVYSRLKRNKAITPLIGGMTALVIDGHESSASYLHHCDGCLERKITTATGERIQYYHRHVMAQLVCGNFYFPLDIEPQHAGEDEVAAAVRLVERVIADYPRAFELILGDGLYLRANFFNLALQHKKDIIVVLKDERRELIKDARGLFDTQDPCVFQDGNVKKECWDIEHFTSWESLGKEVRVVRSRETTTQKAGKEKVSDWIWAGTISKEKLATKNFVELAHRRWNIENNGFNELVNYWHADHVYRHSTNAIEAFWLLTMLSFILFHAFIERNLKAQIRCLHTKLHWASLITAELYLKMIPAGIPP